MTEHPEDHDDNDADQLPAETRSMIKAYLRMAGEESRREAEVRTLNQAMSPSPRSRRMLNSFSVSFILQCVQTVVIIAIAVGIWLK